MTLRTSFVLLSFLLSIAIGVILSKSQSHLVGPDLSSRSLLIGLSLGTLKEERWQRDRDAFVNRAEELGAEVIVQSGNSDGMRQMQDIEALISRGVNALVIVAFNPSAMTRAVSVANEAGIPVICYDRMITDCNVDMYISFDNYKVGQAQAQYLVDELGGQGKIIRIYGPKTDHTGLMFKAGQDDILAPYLESTAIQVIHEDYAEGWKPEIAKKIVNAAITSHGQDFQAVLATNDGTAGGVVQALFEEGLAGNVLVTGQDADLAACQRIQRGVQSMSVYKPLKQLARTAAEVAVKLAKREIIVVRDSVDNGFKQVPAILEDIVVVTQENLLETVVKDGFHKEEDVL